MSFYVPEFEAVVTHARFLTVTGDISAMDKYKKERQESATAMLQVMPSSIFSLGTATNCLTYSMENLCMIGRHVSAMRSLLKGVVLGTRGKRGNVLQ